MFTPEQMAKAKTAKSAEELLAYAKEVGYELTEEDTKNILNSGAMKVNLPMKNWSRSPAAGMCTAPSYKKFLGTPAP